MDMKRFRWTKALALLVALSMVMMYSVTNVAYADINDAKVHYKGAVAEGDFIVVETTVGALVYKAECAFSSGSNYIGSFYQGETMKPLPVDHSFKLVKEDTKIYIKNTGQPLDLEKSSATGGDSLNIFVSPMDRPDTFDLGLMKTVSPASVMVGEAVTFTITVTNNGTYEEEDVIINDLWPTGITQGIALAPLQTSFEENQWTIDKLDPGETKTLTIEGTAAVEGATTNWVMFPETYSDDVPLNNSASAIVNVCNQEADTADLVITKTVNPTTAGIEETVTFVVTVINNGPDAAENVVVNDLWPSGISIGAFVAGIGTFSTETGIWNVGALANGASNALTISGITKVAGDSTNTATVNSGSYDPNLANNSATATVTVTREIPPEFDLGVTKNANPTSMTIGAGVTFTITVTNNGSETQNEILIKDQWPTGVSMGAVTAPTGSAFSAFYNEWAIDTLEPGESISLSIPGTTTALGTITNTALFFMDWDGDEDITNDSATATITVNAQTSTTISTTTRRASIPEPIVPLVEEPTVAVVEDPVPLSDVPQTSDAENIWLLLGIILASGAGISAFGRKKDNPLK